MGRKSKLSPDQWAEAAKRLIDGESERSVARGFGISSTTLREHLAKLEKLPSVQKVAQMIVQTEAALKSMPISSQITAQNLAGKLQSISESLASAADLGAKTSHRLQSLANSQVAKVDDAEPLKSMDKLRDVGILTKLANDSAAIALNLLAANKTQLERMNEPPQDELPPQRPQVTRDEWLKLHAV